MTEDISATYRLAVTVALLSMLTMAVVNLAIIGNNLMQNFTMTYVSAAHTVDTTIVSSINNSPSVSAPTAYKMIEERAGAVKSVRIKYTDGTITSDYKTLLDNAAKSVKVEFTPADSGMYKVEIEEVK